MKMTGYPDVLQLVQDPIQERQRIVRQLGQEILRIMQVSGGVMAVPKALMAAPQGPIHQQTPNDQVTLSILAMVSSRGWYGNR